MAGAGWKDGARGQEGLGWRRESGAQDRCDETFLYQRVCRPVSDDLETVHRSFVSTKRFLSVSSSNHAKINFF